MGKLAIDPRDLIATADYRAIYRRLRNIAPSAPVMTALPVAMIVPPAPAPAPTPEPAIKLAAPMTKVSSTKAVPIDALRHRQILRDVATAFDVPMRDLMSRCKIKTYAQARQAASYLMRLQTKMSLPEIGRRMGRDHTTILHGNANVQAALDSVGSVVYPDTDTMTGAMIIQSAFEGRRAVDESIIAYIAFERVHEAILLGWLESARPFASRYSVFMEWRCCCGRAPVMPGRVKHV